MYKIHFTKYFSPALSYLSILSEYMILLSNLFYVTFKVAPTIMPFTFGEEPFSPLDSTGVQCIITKGDSPVKIGWLFNNETLKNGQNGVNIINISAKTSLLNIASINDLHRGVYVCQAKNIAGIAEYGSELKVNGTHNITTQN